MAVDRTRFNFYGKERLTKKALIFEVIKKFFSEEELENIAQKIPLRRLGRPEEIASVVGFLVSPEASYVTGQVIHVNAGLIDVSF